MDEVAEAKGKTTIELWVDLTCPWCYVGKHRLATAIARSEDPARFEVRLRSFELNPGAPTEPEPLERAFIRAHGGDGKAVLDAERKIRDLAQAEGLAFTLDRSNARTNTVHRVLHYAETLGRGLEFFSSVQDAFFAGRLNPFDPEALIRFSQAMGLDEGRVRQVIVSDEFSANVRADRTEALELGVTGVPFAVFGRELAVSGARSSA